MYENVVKEKVQKKVKPNRTSIPTQLKQRNGTLSFDDVRGNYNSDKSAQLQAIANTTYSNGPNIAQCKMSYEGAYVLSATTLPAINTFESLGARAITGASRGGSVYAKSLCAKSAPGSILQMDYWRDYNDLGLLKDHSYTNPKTLTKMHNVNARLHGPGTPANLTLGTKKANKAHLDEVERTCKDFADMTEKKKKIGTGNLIANGVILTVIPTGGIPAKIENRAAGITNSSDKSNFLAWAGEVCGKRFECNAKFIAKDGLVTKELEQNENIELDIDM